MMPRKSSPATISSLELRHFSASLPMLLLRAREAVMMQFRDMLRGQGLTEQQWRVLRALDATGSSEISDLAHSTFLLGPSLSRILLDLEKRDLIVTQPHVGDCRRKVVQLTKRGAELILLVAPLSEAARRRSVASRSRPPRTLLPRNHRQVRAKDQVDGHRASARP